MPLTLHRSPDAAAFLAVAGDFLAAHEAEHCLILGISGAIVRQPDLFDEPPFFAVVTDADGGIVAATMRTPPFNQVLSLTR